MFHCSGRNLLLIVKITASWRRSVLVKADQENVHVCFGSWPVFIVWTHRWTVFHVTHCKHEYIWLNVCALQAYVCNEYFRWMTWLTFESLFAALFKVTNKWALLKCSKLQKDRKLFCAPPLHLIPFLLAIGFIIFYFFRNLSILISIRFRHHLFYPHSSSLQIIQKLFACPLRMPANSHL